MVNAKLGTKRTCPSCGAHFYDLNANPAKCPKCAHSFNPEDLNKPRRGRGSKKVAGTATNLVGDVKKKPEQKKAKKSIEGIDLDGFDDVETGDGGEDIEAIEEIDEIDNLEEIGEFDEMEDKTSAEDETDEESLIEDMDTGEKKIVDSIEEEE